MRLADLVRIDSRFERSVNLLLDLHNEEKLRLYIPTRSSINLIMSYLQEVTDFHGDRASILIGPYGKGKSHLLLVLLSLLSGRDSEEIRDLINRIGSIDGDAAAKIAAVNRDKKFLPVVINTSSGDLGQAFVKSLIRTLKSEGMDDVVPDNYFSEAVRIIRLWEESFPDTYSALQKMLAGINIDTLIADLERMDALGEHDIRHLGRHIPVPLELDDDKIIVGLFFTAHHIVPYQVHVDRESFGLGFVDQRDTVEKRTQFGTQFTPFVPAFRGYETLYFRTRQRDAFFLRSPFVVLAFDLEEREVGIHILPDAYLLAHELSVMMAKVHVKRSRVVVHGVIGRDALTVYFLREIVGFGGLQDSRQYPHRHSIFGVDAVHQFDALHLT